MATITDPARELGEIAERLTQSSSAAGDQYLAQQFGVVPWSTDFVKIIACILDRADLVGRIVSQSSFDEDHREKAKNHLTGFKEGFTGSSLRKPWDAAGFGLASMKVHGGPIQFFSAVVRPVLMYPKLAEQEVAELIEKIDAYVAEVRRSDEGPVFVRTAIIDGLGLFRFQLEKIGWMGSGYALTAFREVIIIYETVAKGFYNDGNPDAEAFLSGFLKVIKAFKAKVDEAKAWHETGETMWNSYKLATTVATPLLLTGHLPTLPGL